MRHAPLLALLWALLGSGAALAQAPRGDALYVNPAALVSSSRLVGLAGAATGLSENIESLPSNFAAVASRHPRRTRRWDWDFTLAFLAAPVDSLRDVENDGGASASVAPVEGQFGVGLQVGRFGVGLVTRASTRGLCLAASCRPGAEQLQAQAVSGALAIGWAFMGDQLLVGAGIHLAAATFSFAGEATRGYAGASLGLGVNWRSHALPLRVGVSFVSRSDAQPSFSLSETPTLAGRPLYAAAVSPAKLNVGACGRLGREAWRFNRQSPYAVGEHPSSRNLATVPHDVVEDWEPAGAVLVCADLDVVFPVDGATTQTPFLLGGLAPRAGAWVTFIPRVGVEWEAVPRRLRLRGGGYLHPDQIEGAGLRPHVTAGLEVRVARVLGADWSLSLSSNLAPRLFTFSFGLGWWL